jgi:hypothetical protein
MDIEKISFIAQEISFTFEDNFHKKNKRELFSAIFNKYLTDVDPGITTDPYDAIIALGTKDPAAFENMLKELKEKDLVTF